jgi:hypothetical protein
MNTIFIAIYALVASFFGVAAVIQFCYGDPISMALFGLLCYIFIGYFEEAWPIKKWRLR